MPFELKPVKSNFDMKDEVLQFASTNNYQITILSDAIMFQNLESEFKILLRNNTSDFHVFGEVFIKNDYAPLIQIYKKYYPNTNPKNIIDVGANIGCATIALKNAFPTANILSIEAEKNNFQALEKNITLNQYQNVEAINKAFWIDNSNLMIDEDFRDGREWAFAIRPNTEKTSQTIEGITLKNILEKPNFDEIDILKIDIEGGEKWILEDQNTMQLIRQKVKILMIEIHPEVIDVETVISIMQENNFNFIINDALIFAFQN